MRRGVLLGIGLLCLLAYAAAQTGSQSVTGSPSHRVRFAEWLFPIPDGAGWE